MFVAAMAVGPQPQRTYKHYPGTLRVTQVKRLGSSILESAGIVLIRRYDQ